MKKYGMIFPGQGGQHIGMLYELSKKYSIVKKTFNIASEILNYDLWKLAQNGPKKDMDKTYKTQPLILTSSISICKIWKNENGIKPNIIVGHSLGEYSCLVYAKVIKFECAIKLVEQRGKFMQQVLQKNNGLMKVILGLNIKTIKKICKRNKKYGFVTTTNYNTPYQTVIAGNKNSVEKTAEECKIAGAKIISLSISVPAHCILMKPAANKLAKKINKIKFKKPIYPIISNSTILCETNPNIIKKKLIKQLYKSVNWIKIIKYIESKKITNLIEMGPGNILSNLTQAITKNIKITQTNNPKNISKSLKINKENK
ncbi:ACP S-malonyltransferase [Candidatus Purcelliella pentastirinorum]|uniref:ACP S-malonyltransferase n=1 Tax=Candidatus Purcelliella pentastirinorum TaxID=472834 RepID=UPI002367E710|nr:ACP S-malonyltransferase [Candidatus Purcelliella pentastirinorum]WDI79069.1 ACP S-malonyltransferase [Candidatus Purcelliella pentastirinorum]WDR80207.1 ACP S-malonyltransferase [Candidatus Purcelliella pentastirinorum]